VFFKCVKQTDTKHHIGNKFGGLFIPTSASQLTTIVSQTIRSDTTIEQLGQQIDAFK
jgi:hypothetical protein